MRRIPVVVDNTGSLSGSVTVYIVPQSGQRWNLGTIVGARVDTFYYNNPGLSGLYQLVADPVAGRPIYSERFALAANQAARWDLGINNVRVWNVRPVADSRDSAPPPPR